MPFFLRLCKWKGVHSQLDRMQTSARQGARVCAWSGLASSQTGSQLRPLVVLFLMGMPQRKILDLPRGRKPIFLSCFFFSTAGGYYFLFVLLQGERLVGWHQGQGLVKAALGASRSRAGSLKRGQIFCIFYDSARHVPLKDP